MKNTTRIICIVAAVVLIFTCALSFSGCGKTDATKAAEKAISAIGDVNLNSADAISSAQQAYAALSAEEKEKVSNYKTLTNAQEEYNFLKTLSDDINTVIASSESTFSDGEFNVSDNLAKIDDIKTRYGDLKKSQQESISGYDKLDAAAEKLNGYLENAKKTAVQYVKAFYQTEKGKDSTVTAVYCIKQIRNTTDEYHFMALTYKDKDGKEHDVFSGARFTPDVTVEAITSRAEVFFADSAVSDASNAKLHGNVKLNAEEISSAAKG